MVALECVFSRLGLPANSLRPWVVIQGCRTTILGQAALSVHFTGTTIRCRPYAGGQHGPREQTQSICYWKMSQVQFRYAINSEPCGAGERAYDRTRVCQEGFPYRPRVVRVSEAMHALWFRRVVLAKGISWQTYADVICSSCCTKRCEAVYITAQGGETALGGG